LSSELDKLIEVVTDLVLAELDGHTEAAPKPDPFVEETAKPSTRILVCPGPEEVDDEFWKTLCDASVSPSVLVWTGFRADQLAAPCSGWKLETRTARLDKVVSGYKGVVLLGSDLAVLSAIGNLGCGGSPPASAAVAALASGVPVFLDNGRYEFMRRHSSRLAAGFVRRFEEFHRLVSSFGVEFGGAGRLSEFLASLGAPAAASAASRSGGRSVVTVEDVEAVRTSGCKRMELAIGTIVTPLAAQRAAEWGIEMVVQ
jgi:hypothetical protein